MKDKKNSNNEILSEPQIESPEIDSQTTNISAEDQQSHIGTAVAEKDLSQTDKEMNDMPEQSDVNIESDDKDLHKHPSEFGRKIKVYWYTLFNLIYGYCYFVGIQLLRSTRIKRRELKQKWYMLRHGARKKRERRVRNIGISLRSIKRELLFPFREARQRYEKLRNQLEDAREQGSTGNVVKIHISMTGFFLKKSMKVLGFIFNWAFPIVVGFFLFTTIQSAFLQDYGLRVTYAGQELGYVANETVFNQAKSEVQTRMKNEEFMDAVDFTPQYELVPISRGQLLDVDDLSNLLIQIGGKDLKEADGFYLETTQFGRTQMTLIGAVDDGNALLDHLNYMLEKYRTPEMDETAQIQFVKKIQLKRGLYPVSAVKSVDEISAELKKEERTEKRYTVVKGDTPLSIAKKNGVTFDELKQLNPDVDVSLFPGDTLLISASVPRMGVQITLTEKHEEDIEFNIKQETDPSKDIGWTKVTQEGSKGIREVTETIVLIDGVETSRQQLQSKIILQPIDQIMQVGGNKPLQIIPSTSASIGNSTNVPSGAFGWPTTGGRINPGFLGYYGHTGSDISWSGCTGAPIYASADGVVVRSGYGGAYGNRVIVDHGGGYSTLYAHASQLLVTEGQRVSRGQPIALIGRTGNTTGPHLHFEMRVNGTPVNAAPYLYG